MLGGVFKREKEKTQGSGSISRREMEANAPVDCNEQLVPTESVYHTDYEATCLFNFLVKEYFKISYKAVSRNKSMELGFKKSEQDLDGQLVVRKKFTPQTSFEQPSRVSNTTLTSRWNQ